MQPLNGSNFGGLVNRWYQAAENNETGTTFKMELYKDTELAASALESLVNEGSIDQLEILSCLILNTFNTHTTNESYKLINWIGANTLKSGKYTEGAYKSFHHLFEALQSVNNTVELYKYDKSGYVEAVFNHLYSIFEIKEPSTPENIDSAAIDLLKSKDFSIQGHKHGNQIIPNEIINLIEKNIDLIEEQEIANAYRGPLTALKITTADEAIQYAKKFGKEVPYLDISDIDFSDQNKFVALIQNLPKLDRLIAKNSNIKKFFIGKEKIFSSGYRLNIDW